MYFLKNLIGLHDEDDKRKQSVDLISHGYGKDLICKIENI